jgi:hypothetical protein
VCLRRHPDIGVMHVVNMVLKLDEDVMATILVFPACD